MNRLNIENQAIIALVEGISLRDFTSARFTRLQTPALSLYFMYYNFGRVHQSLHVIPATESGVPDQRFVGLTKKKGDKAYVKK